MMQVLASTCIVPKAEDAMNNAEIRVERARLGILQYRVAATLGIPPAALSTIERGHKSVRPEEATRIIETMRDIARRSPAVTSHAA